MIICEHLCLGYKILLRYEGTRNSSNFIRICSTILFEIIIVDNYYYVYLLINSRITSRAKLRSGVPSPYAYAGL